MQLRTMTPGTDSGGPYVQHPQSRAQRITRQFAGIIAVLAIVAVLLVLCGVSAMLAVWLVVFVLAGMIGSVPDWLGFTAIVAWALLTLSLAAAVLYRGLGAICFMVVDWANGRERVNLFQGD